MGDLKFGTVSSDRTVTSDIWNAPNWWRFVANGLTFPPNEGNGQYTVWNQSKGASSIDSVGHLVHGATQYLDSVDQNSLVAQGDIIKAEEMRFIETITTKISPFPIAWHQDVVTYADSALGAPRKALCKSWSLNFDGSDGDYILETIDV